jgi:hypothetical protein
MTATQPTSQSLARILSIRVRRSLIVHLLVSTAVGVLGLVALQWAQAREDFLQIVSGSRHKFKNVTFSNLLSMSRVIYDGI